MLLGVQIAASAYYPFTGVVSMTSEFPDIEVTCPQPSFVSSLLTQCEKSEAAALRDEQSLFSQGAL